VVPLLCALARSFFSSQFFLFYFFDISLSTRSTQEGSTQTFTAKQMQALVYRKTEICAEKEKFNFGFEISIFQREF
jgi:hypothetical protein